MYFWIENVIVVTPYKEEVPFNLTETTTVYFPYKDSLWVTSLCNIITGGQIHRYMATRIENVTVVTPTGKEVLFNLTGVTSVFYLKLLLGRTEGLQTDQIRYLLASLIISMF